MTLPMTPGTVKVYIAPEASIRSYFTVVAVPDDVDTYEFLRDNGWFELANAKGEGLFVLEPGAGGLGRCPEGERLCGGRYRLPEERQQHP